MAELAAFVFCAAIGFAIAGAVTSLYRLVTTEPADFLVARSTITGNLVAVLLTMFGGPHIVARKIVDGLRTGRLSLLPAAVGIVLAGMWSVLAGLVFLSLMISA